MRVIGPNWESTRRLQEAVRGLGEGTIDWGANALNGLEQLRRLKAANINCPTFTTSLEEAKRWVREGKEVWGRELHHTQGKDLVKADYIPATTRQERVTEQSQTRMELKWIVTRRGNRVQRMRPVTIPGGTTNRTVQVPEKWNRKWERKAYWVQVIPSLSEFRQHIFGEKAIRRGKKVKTGEQITDMLVRSRRNGFTIDYASTENPTGMRELAKRAVQVLGYSHAAVDCLVGTDGKVYILECNTAPSLKDDNTLKAYVDAIRQQVQRH